MTDPADLEQPLILTATMEDAAFERFDTQRRAFFPPERNHLQAHITLFHHLPGMRLEAIKTQLEEIARRTSSISVEVTGLRSLGRGVAYRLQAPRLEDLRAELRTLWLEELTEQDRARIKPHVTVQNKVAPDVARETLAILEATFQPWTFQVTGLGLWRYLGGPWASLETFKFTA